MEELDQTNFPGMESLARESHLAGEVKRQTPILVILGNPPYSGHSSNPSEKWITVPTWFSDARETFSVDSLC
jgi:predicted helicase